MKKLNSIKLDELSKVVPILGSNNVQPSDLFDYFRIVALNNRKYENTAQNPLFFLSYTTEAEVKGGWFGSGFDLRTNFNEIMAKFPHATFVIEPDMVEKVENKDSKYIVVENINEATNKLFEYFKEKSRAKVVAVTGSVGKTTAVGLIESILKKKYSVLRIYSKRITPIVLKANVINFLNDEIDYVVLENSIYYHDHVRILSNLLNPDIACILNIESSHLHKDILNTIDDICIYKSEILRHATVGLLNGSDDYLNGLNLEDGIIEYNGEPLFNTKLNHLEHVNMDLTRVEDEQFVINDEIKVKPFMLSKLSKVQYTIAYKIAKILGLTKEEIIEGMNNYQPVENRLQVKQAFGKDIIFDGDITTYERMKELADNQYDKPYLVIRKVGSAENTDRIDQIIEHFDRFEKVFIFSDIAYLDELKNHPKVEIVDNHDFMNNLDGKIIYHYSGYYRVWDTFNEENLHTHDNEKYHIMKA